MTFTEPDAIQRIWPIYEKRLNEEVAEIAAAIPRGTLPSNGTLPRRYASSWKIRKW